MVVAIIEGGAIVVWIVGGIVPVHSRPWRMVHFWFIVVARLVVVPLDNALAFDNLHRPLNVGFSFLVSAQVGSRNGLRCESKGATGGECADEMFHR